MKNSKSDISAAKILAAVITGAVGMGNSAATVQRSHRFPLHLMLRIENMAKMAGVSVSVIINQILEAGMEAVLAELPEEVNIALSHVTQAQVDRPTKSVTVIVKPRNTAKPKK